MLTIRIRRWRRPASGDCMPLHRVVAALVVGGALACSGATAGADVLIVVDKTAQRMSVSVDGEPRWNWPVSTGRIGYDTPNGRHTAFRLARHHYSREWDDAPMPHSIFFTRVGHAIHGTNQTGKIGRPASHGCVRLSQENAAELFALVRQHGPLNTKVVVQGELPPDAPVVAEAAPEEAPTAAADEAADPRAPVAADPDTVPATRANASADSAELAPPEDRAEITTTREKMRQLAERAYAVQPPPLDPAPLDPPTIEPPTVEPRNRAPRSHAVRPPELRQPWAYPRPPSAQRAYRHQRPYLYRAPNVYHDPRVEVIEETYVNGTWVRRRHYYRQARPQDFYQGR